LNTETGVWQKNLRLAFIVLGVGVVIVLLFFLRSMLLPFALGLLLAYLLMPLLKWLEAKLPGGQSKWMMAKRVGLIGLSFLLILVLLALLGYYIVASVAESFSILIQNIPRYLSEGLSNLQNWLRGFREWLPPEVRGELDELVADVASLGGNVAKNIFAKSVSMLSASAGLALSLFSLPLFLFYVLKDWERLAHRLYSFLGAYLGERVHGIVNILDKVIGSWIKSQLVLAASVFIMCFVGLYILGIGLAPALAVLAGMMEFVPIAGPWIAGIAAVVVVLAIAPEKVLWVVLLYVLVQLLENSLLRPRIQGSYLELHPVVIIVLLPIATYLAGIWGMVLYVPLTALGVEIFKYLRQPVVSETG